MANIPGVPPEFQQYMSMSPSDFANLDPATAAQVINVLSNALVAQKSQKGPHRSSGTTIQNLITSFQNANPAGSQVATQQRIASEQANQGGFLQTTALPLAIGAITGGAGLGLAGSALAGGAANALVGQSPLTGALAGSGGGALGGSLSGNSLFSALDSPAAASTGADAATLANFAVPAAGTSAIQAGIAGGALPAASAADVASMATGLAAQGASASAISSTLAGMGVPGTVADAAASLGTSGMNAADLGSFLGTGSTAGVSAAGSSILQSLGSIAGGPVGKLIGALAPAAGAAIGALTGPSIPQLPNQAQAGASLYGAISAYPGQAAQYAGTNPQYANQAFQSQFNNPYAGQALQGAQQAGQMATGAAGQAYGSGQSLLNAQNQILQSSMDPQQALYNQLLQQTTDQTRAGETARGLAMSPVGSQIESNALNQFNIDWQNQQLNRQIAGANAAGTAGRTGAGLQGVGTQYMQQGSQYPYAQAQDIAQNQFGAIGANQAAMQGGLAPQQQNIQNLSRYVGLGAQSMANAAQMQNYNAATGLGWGDIAQSAIGGLSGLFPNTGSTSGSSGLFPSSGSNTSLAFAGGSNYGAPLL